MSTLSASAPARPAFGRALPPLALAVLAALFALVVVLGIRAVAAVRQPLPALPRPAPAPDPAILSRFDPFVRDAPAAATEALPVTALPLVLKGVRLDPVSGRGVAILAGPDGVQSIHEVGATVLEGVTLAAVQSDHVVLNRAGTSETLWLDESQGTPPALFSAPASAAPPAAPPPSSATAGSAPPAVLPDGNFIEPVPPSGESE
ncbi:type II secretion system protein N [Thermaurantiacus sp.]